MSGRGYLGVVKGADYAAIQLAVCTRFRVEPLPAPTENKVGIAANVLTGLQPVNGLRHRPAGDTTCWYVWAGAEMSSDPTFFEPVHVEHLIDLCPAVVPYL